MGSSFPLAGFFMINFDPFMVVFYYLWFLFQTEAVVALPFSQDHSILKLPSIRQLFIFLTAILDLHILILRFFFLFLLGSDLFDMLVQSIILEHRGLRFILLILIWDFFNLYFLDLGLHFLLFFNLNAYQLFILSNLHILNIAQYHCILLNLFLLLLTTINLFLSIPIFFLLSNNIWFIFLCAILIFIIIRI